MVLHLHQRDIRLLEIFGNLDGAVQCICIIQINYHLNWWGLVRFQVIIHL